ncbi:MAG: DUF882 domain-containing protein [Hyphomicrobiaceae bacterium]|nr:DUF882 domain-containing protein [Hyphomicrobiaceae bacterium]
MPVPRRAIAVAIAVALLGGSGGAGMTANSNRDRTISFYAVNTKEALTIQYMKNGKHIPEAMEKINWILRDWRKDEPTQMDPDLIDLVWEIHNELGSAEPINVISGYRSRDTNELLRRTVGGQASQSRHILGKAMDVTFPDVPVKKLRYSALIRERGGVGYYPTSATPFVHVDTDRVRAWPRLPRQELALLFPDGRTQHVPEDGGPITPEDVRRARAANAELAQQIAEVLQLHAHPRPPMQVAALGPSLPQLLSPPRLVDRASLGRGPSDDDRARLAALADEPLPRLMVAPTPANRPPPAVLPVSQTTQSSPVSQASLASISGGMRVAGIDPAAALKRLKWGASLSRETTFVPAPAYDEEHPEELSYRPFPIAPLLTATASVDDPALARMVHPDIDKILEMLDQMSSAPPMHLRPGPQTARLMWAQEFKGEAVNLSSLIEPGDAPRAAPTPLAERRVLTQPQ